jgi:hypothetical protein
MLLAVLFMMAIMIIVALAVAPSVVFQAKRDHEEEMIHRGTEYARAVKKYYKKFGRYPANLEQLDNTNQIRFLRKRYKDPLTKDGQWKLLHYGDIASIVGANAQAIPGQQRVGPLGVSPNANLGVSPTAAGTNQSGNTALGAAQQLLQQQQQSAISGNQPQAPQQSSASPADTNGTGSAPGASGFSLSTGSGQSSSAGGGQAPDAGGQAGSNNTIFGNTGVGGQTFGGGAIVGVASKSKDKTIRIFNKKKTYDEWVFIYNPSMDQANVLLRGPYNGQTINNTQIGTPAGQLNQQIQGQQPGGLGQQPAGYGQQNPQQQLTPGNQFPPDQSQPPH